MKIGVLIPSDEYKSYAGARIRYGRIAPALKELGHSLVLEDIATFDPLSSEHDALLISKCFDSRSLVLAELFAQRGRLTGVDLFDDYFSQDNDARTMRFRNWLVQVASIIDFALCSTERMADVVQRYNNRIATHVMNDPSDDCRSVGLSSMLEKRLNDSLHQRRLRIVWFGVGDNPYFRVGLHDLAAFGSELRLLLDAGYDVELHILTNARALDAVGLELLRTLPVRAKVIEWTEEREAELLASCIAAFIPVNAQGFSAAKSLNRAITALNAGCQVISSGYPLYAALSELVYCDIVDFIADLAGRTLKLSGIRMPIFDSLMDRFALAKREADALVTFLLGLHPRREARYPVAILHGIVTNGEAHKRVQAAGGLSVKSPFCTTKLGFDVIFLSDDCDNGLTLLVSDKARAKLRPELQQTFASQSKIDGRSFWFVSSGGRQPAPLDLSEEPLPSQLAVYRRYLDFMADEIKRMFGPHKVIFSEAAQLPLSAPRT